MVHRLSTADPYPTIGAKLGFVPSLSPSIINLQDNLDPDLEIIQRSSETATYEEDHRYIGLCKKSATGLDLSACQLL